MGIIMINAANHEDKGIWCSCGETVKDCYYLGLLVPAHRAWKERIYAEVFASVETEGNGQ